MSKEQLIIKAAELASAAPRQWKEFLVELKNHCATRKDECVQAPAEAVRLAQGRAQECAFLVERLENAVTAADRITSRRTN